MAANDMVQNARLAAWETYQAPGNGMVAKRVDGGQTALFAFRGTYELRDWGTDSEVELAVLGTAIDLFPHDAIDSSARVHAGFLTRFRETLSAAAPDDLRKQTAMHAAQVVEACGDPTVQRIVFTGHSLGGAIALLAYVWAHANAGRLHNKKVECVTFGAPMVGDDKLSKEITDRQWGAGITNIVTRHDIVPRVLLAAWDGGKIAGLGALLVMCSGLTTRERRKLQAQLPAQQGGLPGLVRKVKETGLKFAMGVSGAVSHTVPALGALQTAAVQLVKGYPDTSDYRPFGRFFFVFGEDMAMVENPKLSFRLLHLTMLQPSTTPDHGGVADYIRDHVVYPDLPKFDVSRPAEEDAMTAQAVAATVDSFFILGALARLNDGMRNLHQNQQMNREAELMDMKQGMTDALAVIAKYGNSTAERYRKFRYTWPRTTEEERVEAARRMARDYWQSAQRYYSTAELPHDFLSGHRLAQANNYRLLFEPIDIANYYRPWATDKKAIRFEAPNGPYLQEFEDPSRNNRPVQYTWIEKAWKEAHPDDPVESSVLQAEEEETNILCGKYRSYGVDDNRRSWLLPVLVVGLVLGCTVWILLLFGMLRDVGSLPSTASSEQCSQR